MSHQHQRTRQYLGEFLKGELNIVVTPHTAWLTEEAPERYARILARRIIEALEDKALCESEFMSSLDAEVGKCPPDVVVVRGVRSNSFWFSPRLSSLA